MTDDRPRAVLAGDHDLDVDSATTKGVNTAGDKWPYLGPVDRWVQTGYEQEAWPTGGRAGQVIILASWSSRGRRGAKSVTT